MFHAALLALGLASCNAYEGDGWCWNQSSGGNVAQLAQNEGYGLPLPVLLSDFPIGMPVTETALQDAISRNDYVIVQATSPVKVHDGLKIPSGHFLEGAYSPNMVTLEVAEPTSVLFDLSDNQENVRVDNFILGGGMAVRGSN